MFLAVTLLLAFIIWYFYERSHRRVHPVTSGLHEEIELPHDQEWEIYQNLLSFCSKKLRVCMEELDLPYRSHHIDLIETGCYENLSRNFLKVNPGCTVPVLIHCGHPVYESHEQIVYAAEQAGERGQELLGRTPEIRAEVRRWIDFGALKGDPTKGGEERAGHSVPGLTIPIFTTMIQYIPWWRLGEGLLFHLYPQRPLLFSVLKFRGIHKLPLPARKAIRTAHRNMNTHLDLLEDALSDERIWICGESFTLADISCMAIFERIDEVDWSEAFLSRDKHPAVSRYWERLKERPSYATALAPRSEVHERALRDLKEAKSSSRVLREELEEF